MADREKLKSKGSKEAIIDDLVAYGFYGLYHELRTPLATLAGFVQLVQVKIEGVRKHIDPDVFRYLKTCEQTIEDIHVLLDGYVNLASLRRFARKRINLNRLIEHAIANLVYTKTDPPLLELDERLPQVEVSTQQLEYVIRTLISNALEAVEKGKGKVRVRTCTDKESGDVRIIVSDYGSGIAKKDIPHIFEPFFTTKEKGIGLGLTLAKKSVDLHEGSIKCTSRLGKGSTFEIRLPTTRKRDETKNLDRR